MEILKKLNFGLAGALGRGASFRRALEANGACIHAVCDLNPSLLESCRKELGASESYTDFSTMLEKSDLDAVVIATPMPWHVAQSIVALKRGVHVLSEVPAAVSVEECKALAAAAAASKAIYMMAENYTYIRENVVIRELVRQGLFGKVYYAEGEYLHDVKELSEATPWRRKWQLGIEGVTYGTHSLGPILQWMPRDRVVKVCVEGSGQHYRDPRGEAYHQDTSVMLCKTRNGALIKIRVDLLSERPHAMTNYSLQGTEGSYESGRAEGEHGKIWLRSLDKEIKWHDLDELLKPGAALEKHLPETWRHASAEALASGHGGGDYFEVLDFIEALRGNATSPIGIHESLDMTLPGLISQQSALQHGAWLPVPDSRDWVKPDALPGGLRMLWPANRLDSPPAVKLPPGYQLRQFRPEDESKYLDLMHHAGFVHWNKGLLDTMLGKILQDGFFIIEGPGGRISASAMATHCPSPWAPFGAELGWVAGDSADKGKGLGEAVCSASLARMIAAGYKNIYLLTDDFRLPALKVYLKMGFKPLLNEIGFEERWKIIFEKLGWKE